MIVIARATAMSVEVDPARAKQAYAESSDYKPSA
jgi:hypothetical protein